MLRKTSSILLLVVLSLVVAVPALADAPNFSAAVYADGTAWGTKGTTSLPAPNAYNAQSYDALINEFPAGAAAGQLGVAEAAPGNPNYNGGRWTAYKAIWHSTPVLLTSWDQVEAEVQAGNLELQLKNDYFQCPLLPVK
jgi:hypothetical protein